MDEYKWLIEALKPECDQVIEQVRDMGSIRGLGCRWGTGAERVRTAIAYIEDDVPVLNNAIAAGSTTREAVIADLLSHRPKDWAKATPA